MLTSSTKHSMRLPVGGVKTPRRCRSMRSSSISCVRADEVCADMLIVNVAAPSPCARSCSTCPMITLFPVPEGPTNSPPRLMRKRRSSTNSTRTVSTVGTSRSAYGVPAENLKGFASCAKGWNCPVSLG
eukprot:1444169-Rhodomonas_salina.2